jgi:tryptophan 5-monooxygenase
MQWEKQMRISMTCIFIREFAKSIPRPFSVRYNPYTESVEVIKDKPSVQKLVSDIKYSVDILQDAMGKME